MGASVAAMEPLVDQVVWAQSLAATIRAERAAAGISQADVLERTGIARTVYWRIEQGTRVVDVVQLRAIAEAIGTTVPDLLARTDTRYAETIARQDPAT